VRGLHPVAGPWHSGGGATTVGRGGSARRAKAKGKSGLAAGWAQIRAYAGDGMAEAMHKNTGRRS